MKDKCKRGLSAPMSVDQLSHKLVSEWIDNEKVCLRPAQKLALKKAIVKSLPSFININKQKAFAQYEQSIREEERKACLAKIAELNESFPGFISKQRVLNTCVYGHSGSEEKGNPNPKAC